MKHVWILNHYAQEPNSAGGTRHFHLAEYLQDFGWHATLIAASVDHGSGRQRLSHSEDVKLEKIQDVDFLWIRTPEYIGNGGGRIGNMLSYAWNVLKPNSTKNLTKPDVIIGSSVHPFAAVAGALLAKKYKVPFIFEVRDLWPQTLIDMGRLKEKAFITWILRKLEIWLYRRSSRIVVLLPLAWKYIEPLGIPKNKIVWIPNGVDLSFFPDAEFELDSDSDAFTLMYFGAHGQANGLNTILDAMYIVEQNHLDKPIKLRMIGDGPLKEDLIAYSKSIGLKNISFEDSIPKSKIPKLASSANAFVISILDLPNLYRYGVSMNKLFDYLAAGRPIIISSGAANNPVADAGAGYTVSPGDPQLLADAILKMASASLLERQRMGSSGRDYVKHNHGFDKLASKLANVLTQVSVESEVKSEKIY